MKKRAVILIFFICLFQMFPCVAKEIPVKIVPAYKVTTCNESIQEGDFIEFFVAENVNVKSKIFIPKGQKVRGTLTNLEDNDILLKPASIYIEDFETTDINGKEVSLNGIVYKKGNDHSLFKEIILIDFIRGGEVYLVPEKDKFILFLKEEQ